MRKTLILSSLLLFFLNSCERGRNNRGCTDPYASNYNAYASFDNGNCSYTADVVFCYDEITAYELNLLGFDRLDYYIEEEEGTFINIGSEYPINGEFIGEPILGPIGSTYIISPNCYEPTYITIPIEWYSVDNTVINYLVYGVNYVLGIEVETLVDEYSFNLYANECAAVPIRFLTKKKKE